MLLFIVFNISLIDAMEIGFIEKYSLSENRKKALQELIPGTSDYYYYNCLYYQHMKEFDQTEALLKQWIKREGYTPQVREILNRQALFGYHSNPSKSLDYIQDQMNLRFDHQKEMDTQKKLYDSRLNQQVISSNYLKKQAFSRYRDLSGFENSGLDILNPEQLTPDQRRDFLKRLKLPDVKGLPKLVIDDLEAPHSSGFGSHHIHKLMLKTQLDECLKLAPDLINQSNFVNEYIRKLAPADIIDLRYDMDEKKAYLSRLWHFAEHLNPSYNSLKAHVLYHILDFNRSQGDYNYSFFLEYLSLPKNAHYYHKRRSQYRQDLADLNADYQKYTLLPSIITDEELIKDFLMQFFSSDKDASYYNFQQYLDIKWLQNIFVEAKIVNMAGDMEEWFSLISQHRFQEIKDRVDIDFAKSNQQFFSTRDPVALQLYIKNVDTLIVKIFEINTLNYYSTFHKEPDTGINLDGLAPTHEKTFTYDTPPFLRSLKTFTIPEINKPGVFVVEFIGNGKSSRAIIRKGKLFCVNAIGAAGHEFRVFDENNQSKPDAVIKFDGYEYKTDQQGIIIIPYSTHPKYQPIIIQNKDFCALSGFDHLSEQYALNVGFYVDRESLLTQRKSKVLIKPALSINNYGISLSLLKDISLHIESIDMDGVSSSKVVSDFTLFEDQDSVYEFQVPENLSKIRFQLSATIDNISQQKTEPLMDNELFLLNDIDQTPHLENFLLNHENNTYTLEVLGKNGEPRMHRSVKIELKHKFFRKHIIQQLQTDNNGCIDLGALKNISDLEVSLTNNYSYKWHLSNAKASYPTRINGHVNDVIQLPYYAQRPGRQWTLFEKRGSTFLSDQSHAVTYSNGCLQIKGLAPGNYDLFLKSNETHIAICVDKGIQKDDIILSDHSALKIESNKLPYIGDIQINDHDIVIYIGNTTDFTRLHVVATRFLPAYSMMDHMCPPDRISGNRIGLTKPVSQYISGRNIGDEFRYILDRKYADKYPGNMLSKPGLLLNPWSIRKTDTKKQELKPDEEYAIKESPALLRTAGAPQFDNDNKNGVTTIDQYSSINFLNETSLMLFNLKHEKNGTIIIKRDQCNAFRHLHLMIVDPSYAVYRNVSLPKTTFLKKDLRLKTPFDLKKHFTEQKRISTLQPEESLSLSNMKISKFEIFDSIEKVFGLLRTINDSSELNEFEFIIKWPELSQKDKLKHYSEKSCHELNFFLFHKDRPFFQDVILPYISHKKDKTFLDHWLLSDNLDAYTSLYAFSNLNIAEKILLARSLSNNMIQIDRYVNDLFNMIPPDTTRYNFLYDISLKGAALDENDFSVQEAGEESSADVVFSEIVAPCAIGALEDFDEKNEKAFSKGKKHVRKLYYAPRKEARSRTRSFFKKLDKTNEWAENNYYKRPKKEQNAELINVNAFWNDFAEHDMQSPFLSKHIMYANTNFSEIMLALAVLDLPFRAKNHKIVQKGNECTITAASPMIVFHKEILEGELMQNKHSIKINLHFFQLDDRYEYMNNERRDKFVENEFLPGISYGAQVVVSNPSSSYQKLVVMYQIPEGSIPVNKGKYSEGIQISLKPFSTKAIEYFFYFPKVGNFSAYPVQVAADEKCIASTNTATFKVVQQLSQMNTRSWKYISQNGSNEDVLQYLKENNLNRLDLKKIAFRMKDRSFFHKVIGLLRSRQFFHSVIWSYGLYHQDQSVITQYLEQSSFASNCGMFIESPLLTIRPVARNNYEHLEYAPFVNARVHQLGNRHSLLNERFFKQYNQFLTYLSYRPALNATDLMAITCYLFTQDRITQAIHFFNRIQRKDIDEKIQYDYIHAYVLMYQGKTSEAENVIRPYLDYPVVKWQNKFSSISSQINSIHGNTPTVVDEKDRSQLQTQLAATEKNFDFKIVSRRIHLTYQNMAQCQIKYYPMDIELLFSRNPFVQKQTNEFMIVQPDTTALLPLPEDQTTYEIDLPAKYHNSNLIIEITAQGKRQSHVCYANSIHLQVIENYGQIHLTHEDTHVPLSKAYVKVYAQLKNKDIQFHKDGYTDLRGYFDYVSLNTEDLDRIEKFAILVIDEKYGAVTKVATVPKR